jgi:hypothetical protein
MSRVGALSLRRVSALLIALAIPFAFGSCQSIAGIDDRELGPCSHFCDVVMQNCAGDNRVYETREKCMGVCKLYPVGDANEWQGKNTLECRLHEAELAATAADEEVSNFCRSAGPEGINCGSECENYCYLYEKACDQVQCGSTSNCVAKCAALRDNHEYNVVNDYEGNSIQCRFVHLSNASIIAGGQPHCGHANLSTPTDHCNDLPDSDEGVAGASSSDEVSVKPSEPDCKQYCQVNGVSCGTTQYESRDQCLALCKFLPVGEFSDTNQNTLGCRIYHSYNSLCAPEQHCPHSGPSGEGHCGTTPQDKCLAYCTLAKGICPSQYSTAFQDDDDACAANCAQLPDALPAEEGPTRYTTTYAATPGTVACRFLALSRAAEDINRADCANAFGGGICAPPP